MSLRHAILVMLEAKPGSGYDLRRRFDSGIGNFWYATHQQVYQELKKLHDEKLVEFKLQAQSDRPDRKVYRLTRAGRAALKAWFREPVEPPRLKQALLIKLFGAALTDAPALLAELERHEQLHREELARYREAERQYFAQDELTRHEFLGPYLTLRCGIRYARDWIESLQEARELLRAGAPPRAPVPGRGAGG
jgi:PadR family transcriptional regulator, regulatory protein AphA